MFSNRQMNTAVLAFKYLPNLKQMRRLLFGTHCETSFDKKNKQTVNVKLQLASEVTAAFSANCYNHHQHVCHMRLV